MIASLALWLESCAKQADADGFDLRAAACRDAASTLAELVEFEPKEVLSYLETCCADSSDVEVDSGNPQAYPAILLGHAIDGFAGAFSAPARKQLDRAQEILAYVAPRGGLRAYLASEGHRGEKSLIGLVRQVEAHKVGDEVSETLQTALKQASVGRLRNVAKRLDVVATGGKPALLKAITIYLTGAEVEPATAAPSTVEARRLLTEIRQAAARGESENELREAFTKFESLAPEVIVALGREYRFAEREPRKLLKHFWASIETVWAQSMRR